MVNVLQVMGNADLGGICTVVLNYCTHIDRTKFHVDLVLNAPDVGRSEKAFLDMGSTIYRLPQKHNDFAGFSKGLRKILVEKHYDVVHVHHDETSYVALRIAKQMGIPCRIAHSHTRSPVSNVKDELKRISGIFLNPFYATHVLGCGKLAGDRVFGKAAMRSKMGMVLPNAIDTDRFAYSSATRKEVKEELGITGCVVIGMIGRLSSEKNNLFPLRFLPTVTKSVPNVCLLYAGGGKLESAIRDEVSRLGLWDHVRMLGSRNDMERIYQALDVLIMPSLFEGFPMAAVEAMASGLPVLLSDNITREFEFGSAVRYLSLDDPNKWAETVCEMVRLGGREERQHEVREYGFDIRDSVKQLEQLYLHDIQKNR